MPDSIAHYRLGNKLGQGAMGEVYRATDTKLGRDVAIKLIAPNLTQDAARMANFTREAHVLASLNHPNIAAIYGVEDQALVMELVEGPTLAERIKQDPVPLDEALAIARQIAAALESAHEKGIVHRDLKPGNIKITPDGTVKLLDFGLAKAAAVAAAPDDAMTVALSMTGGLIVGTPGYMAPEQARGRPVDKRADIWAFGVVLYEMLTGATLFEGDTVTDVMASVVRQEPDLTRVPATVRPLLGRCLEKDPKHRLRDIGDAMLLLDDASDAAPATPASTRSGKIVWLGWTAAAVFLLTTIAVLLVHFREAAPIANRVRFKIALPENLSFTPGAQFAISPDGQKLAFIAQAADREPRVWLQELDALEPRQLPGSDVAGETGLFAWSPDSRFIVSQHDGKLKRFDTTGGPAQTIGDLRGPVFGGAWHANGTILLGSPTGILQVSSQGGTPVAVTKVDASRKEPWHGLPAFFPDGRGFLYLRGGPLGERGLSVGLLDAKPEDPPATPIVMSDIGGALTPVPGSSTESRLLFVREGTLVAQRFDTRERRLTGEVEPVAQELLFANFPYSVSDGGTLVYRTGTVAGRIRRLAWFDREGKAAGVLSERARYGVLKLSPDASRAVTVRTDMETGDNADLWLTDLVQDTSTRFTFDPELDAQPAWSPDSKYLAWIGIRKGVIGIYRKPSDGGGSDELLYKFDGEMFTNLTDWSADGRFLIYNRSGDVFALPVEGTASTRQPIPVVQTAGVDFGAYVSPDSRWISYISNESGRQEIYVQPFAPGWRNGTAPVGGKWMVSRGALGMNRWRADSKELLFVAADGMLMSVVVTSSPVFKASAPRALFQLPRPFLTIGQNPGAIADASRDNQRFLLVMPSEEAIRQEMTVVLNWQNGLSR